MIYANTGSRLSKRPLLSHKPGFHPEIILRGGGGGAKLEF